MLGWGSCYAVLGQLASAFCGSNGGQRPPSPRPSAGPHDEMRGGRQGGVPWQHRRKFAEAAGRAALEAGDPALVEESAMPNPAAAECRAAPEAAASRGTRVVPPCRTPCRARGRASTQRAALRVPRPRAGPSGGPGAPRGIAAAARCAAARGWARVRIRGVPRRVQRRNAGSGLATGGGARAQPRPASLGVATPTAAPRLRRRRLARRGDRMRRTAAPRNRAPAPAKGTAANRSRRHFS
jgi:hypothetical protein